MEKYDITDYLKDDKELQKAVIEEFLKEIAELKALKGLITVGSKQQYQCLQKIDELEQENERLKEKIESYVCSQNCYAYKQADNYRQTLQEIKEIAEKLYYTDLCENKKSLDEILDEVHEILQKINGAEIK